MAAPSFVSAGTLVIVQTGSSAVTKTCTVGNFVILQVLSDGTGAEPAISSITNIANIAGTGSAMTKISGVGGANVGAGAEARQVIWLGRVTSASTSVTVAVNGSGDDCYCVIWEFTDVSAGTTNATVFENSVAAGTSNGTPGTSTTIADTAVVTLGVDRLAVNFIAVNDDNQASFDTEAFTGQTGGTWVCGGGFGSATGTDGSVGLQWATMAAAATIDGGTLTMASDPWGVFGFALIGTTVARATFAGPTNFQDPGMFQPTM